MATRLLVMFSVMLVELGGGIAGILGVVSQYPYNINEGGAAAIVAIVSGILVAWLLTIALFVRKSSRSKTEKLLNDARMQAAKILDEATEKALALLSLDAGKCNQCGNPRTGKFCPKCGSAGESAAKTPLPAVMSEHR